jgi:hypothetical protein
MPQTGPVVVCTSVPAAQATWDGAERADVLAWTAAPVPAARITAAAAAPSNRDRRGMNRIVRMLLLPLSWLLAGRQGAAAPDAFGAADPE